MKVYNRLKSNLFHFNLEKSSIEFACSLNELLNGDPTKKNFFEANGFSTDSRDVLGILGTRDRGSARRNADEEGVSKHL